MFAFFLYFQAAQQEALVSNAEASRLERDLAAARTAAMANGVGVKSRLQTLQIAYVLPSHLSLIVFPVMR